MEGPIQWRTSKPNFAKVDRYFMKEKSRNHKENSLEMMVENLVKTWEMEASHKVQAKVNLTQQILTVFVWILSIYFYPYPLKLMLHVYEIGLENSWSREIFPKSKLG